MSVFVSLLVSVLVLAIGVAIYNRLVRLATLADNAWSDIQVQLKRRHDLIPNLVEVVKGYATHEQKTLEAVIQARNSALSAPNPQQRMEAENMLTTALRQIFALAEAYPDLKANQNFLALQQELSAIEQDIANARRYYNAVVRDYNTRLASLPDNLVAALGNFRPRPFFVAEEEAHKVPRVEF